MTKKAALKWYVGKVACNDVGQVLDGLDIDWDKEDFTKDDLKAGLEVESEHTVTTEGDVETMAHIALDHLKEFPTYYAELDKMEKKLDKKAALKAKLAQITMQAAGAPPPPSTNNTTAVGDPSNVVKPPKWTSATKGQYFQKVDKSPPTTIAGLGTSQHESMKIKRAEVVTSPILQLRPKATGPDEKFTQGLKQHGERIEALKDSNKGIATSNAVIGGSLGLGLALIGGGLHPDKKKRLKRILLYSILIAPALAWKFSVPKYHERLSKIENEDRLGVSALRKYLQERNRAQNDVPEPALYFGRQLLNSVYGNTALAGPMPPLPPPQTTP